MTSDVAARRKPTRAVSGDRLRVWARRVLIVNLVAQIGIVVTGGLVRVTGSGLGCPTWPQCVPGSYTPVVRQAQGFHKYIEFGNRTLTGVVTLTALAVLIAVLLLVRAQVAPRRHVVLGAAPLLLVVTQAVLGGVTVLLGLNPVSVAAHFLVSMVLIVASTWLLLTVTPPLSAAPGAVVADAASVARLRPELRGVVAAVAGLAGVILVLGTVVTGSGPHSGDAVTPARLGFDPATVSWLHADAVWLFVGLVVTLLVALRLIEDTDRVAVLRRRTAWLLGVTLAQGVIGYVQYATGLPALVVVLHMLGASLLVAAVTAVVQSATPASGVIRGSR